MRGSRDRRSPWRRDAGLGGHTAAVPTTDAPTEPELLRARLRTQRRFRLTELLVAALTLVVILAILLALPPGADESADEVTGAIVAIMVVIGLQWALMLRLGWRVYDRPASRRLRRKAPFRGWWATPFTPLLALALTLPWALDGVLGTRETLAEDLWLLFLLFVMAAGLGLLAVPAVLVPVEMLLRGVVRLVTARGPADRQEGTSYLWGAFGIAALTTFVLVVGAGADFDTGGRAAWGSVVLALLGVPLGYDVRSPVLLWVGRVVLYAFLAYVVVEIVRRRRSSGRPAAEK